MLYVWMDGGIKFNSGLIQNMYVHLKKKRKEDVTLNINTQWVLLKLHDWLNSVGNCVCVGYLHLHKLDS